MYEFEHPETKHGASGGGHEKSRVSDSDTLVERFTLETAKEVGKEPEIETQPKKKEVSYLG